MNKLNQLTINQSQEGMKKNQFSCQELVEDCLKRIEEIDEKIKAFITVCKERAIQEAKEKDEIIQREKDLENLFQKYPLFGIPVAVKDSFCTAGIKTTAASRVLENYIPTYDATAVKKLKEAGAIIIGKTNLDAWCHGSSTEASDFFTTHNPWNLNRLPGGSSGGSAAAVAADMVIGAIGSETAGSIRQPASWCGVVGLKPTYGRVSRFGLIAMASSLDCPGPITKTVEDSAIILRVLAGKDEYDSTSLSTPVSNYLEKINRGVEGIKIGLPKEYFFPQVQKEVIEKVREAIRIFEKMGAKIEEISLFDPQYAIAVYTILQRAEVSSNLARYDGIRYGRGREFFGEEAKRRIMLGTFVLSAGFYEAYYLRAQKVRTLICQDFERAFKKVDVIVAPTSPSVALPLGSSKESPMFGEIQDVLVEPSTIAGLPGINICCGFSSENLPIGFQIIGPQLSEELLFRVAFAYQNKTQWNQRKPKI
jgi:aspartyl-tRNA(Asn)/glutamyl-tRNA(Gln) amidotransferase subunit A